jgi:hypothetical protein
MISGTPWQTVGQQHGGSENMDTQSGGSLADRIAALQAAKQHDTGGSSNSASNTKVCMSFTFIRFCLIIAKNYPC